MNELIIKLSKGRVIEWQRKWMSDKVNEGPRKWMNEKGSKWGTNEWQAKVWRVTRYNCHKWVTHYKCVTSFKYVTRVWRVWEKLVGWSDVRWKEECERQPHLGQNRDGYKHDVGRIGELRLGVRANVIIKRGELQHRGNRCGRNFGPESKLIRSR